MQEKININPHRARSTPIPPIPKKIHKLMIIKLRLQQPIKRDLRKRARDHHTPLRSLNLKDASLIRTDGDFNAVPLALRVSVPTDQDTFFSEVAGRVLERAEEVGSAAGFEFAEVVVLACKGQEEAAFFVLVFGLEGYHGLLDVVVVTLELALEEMRFFVECGEGAAHAF